MPRSPGGSPSATRMTFQVCSYNSATDTATVAFDLNDGVTTGIHYDSIKLDVPKPVVVSSGNIRSDGEKVVRRKWPNRKISVSVFVRGANTQAILDTLSSLRAAIVNPPYVLCLALPGQSAFRYADVVAVEHNIPSNPVTYLGGAAPHVELTFICKPGLRGDRVTLSNLVSNPGFEAPSGPAVPVFNDSFANVNAYSVVAGSAPTVASNVMTIAANTTVQFGSPAWGAINLWSVRWQYLTGASHRFYLHGANDANNSLFALIFSGGGGFSLRQEVGGTANILASAGPTLTNANFYWLQITQFPGAAIGSATPYLTATLYNDSAGAVGTQVATISANTHDSVTALSGRAGFLATGASLPIGGAFSNVHTLSLFGPGAWMAGSSGTGLAAGAWEQSTSNTYPNGPVTSYGAARLDAAPAGALNAQWNLYSGGAPAGTLAIPVSAAGNVAGVAVYTKSSGLGVSATIAAYLREFDSGGTFLRQTAVQTLTGNQSSWTKLSGTVTTGASCAYLDVLLNVVDTTTGSANGTVWFDNVQVWNQTTTGQTSMPFCALRFPQAPAQLVVSGLVGELPAPAFLALGVYLSNWPSSNTPLVYALGTRALPTAGGQLVQTYYQNGAPTLDASSYGGYYVATASAQTSFSFLGPVATEADLQGVYHLFTRFYTGQSTANIAKVTVQPTLNQVTPATWTGSTTMILPGTSIAPLSTGAVWSIADAGQVTIPPTGTGSLTDLTQIGVQLAPTWSDANGGGSLMRANWQALLPVDGDLFIGSLINPLNVALAVTNSWYWIYAEGLGAQTSDTTGLASSIETTALPVPAHGAGGPGSTSSDYYVTNATGAPFLRLYPQQVGSALSGVNEMLVAFVDNNGSPTACAVELQYAPLYLGLR